MTGEDYSAVKTALNSAITTASGVYNKSDATKTEVNNAFTALDTALTVAQNTKAVIDAIKALPASDNVKTTDRTAIEQALTDYNALSSGAQLNIPDSLRSKLTLCITAVDKADFNAYKADQKTTAGNMAQESDSQAATALITDAKNAIEALTYDTSKTLAQNKSAVDVVITQLTTDLANQRAADPVIAQINALPATDAITSANKDAIEAARGAYNALNNAQKAKVPTDKVQKLTDAEAALKEAIDTETANGVSALIDLLPEANNVTTADKTDIEAARKAYNDLTNDQKAKVSTDTLKKLTDAEDSLAAAEVSDKINALPATSDVTTANKTAIEAARKAYNDLTNAQKAYVSNDTLNKLTDTENALAADRKSVV